MISTGGDLTILESVDSTNNYAMALVRTGLAKHGDAFFAMEQTSGKGQRGKDWITEKGANIIITLVMRPRTLQLWQQFQLSTAMALAAHDFFAHYAGDETKVKWPNDIYWRDRKAGGILIESIIGTRELDDPATSGSLITDHSPPTSWQWAVIGIGININQTVFSGNARNAVSLKQITGRDYDVVELAKQLCAYVQNRYGQLPGNHSLQEYNERLYKRGATVNFKKGSRLFEGTVKEVTPSGELVVITATEEHFGFGEIEWVLK